MNITTIQQLENTCSINIPRTVVLNRNEIIDHEYTSHHRDNGVEGGNKNSELLCAGKMCEEFVPIPEDLFDHINVTPDQGPLKSNI